MSLNSSETEDIAAIKIIFLGIPEDQTHREIYLKIRDEAFETGSSSDKDYMVLSKWLWKYREFTIKQFLNQ